MFLKKELLQNSKEDAKVMENCPKRGKYYDYLSGF
jgi:hypothetical protein